MLDLFEEQCLVQYDGDTKEKIKGIVETHVAIATTHIQTDTAILIQKAQSPIEAIFGAALVLALGEIAELEFDYGDSETDCPAFADAQVKVGQYRVDFLVRFPTSTKKQYIVIECDGHDHHERTKEQATRDRRRDRQMLARGILVMRFTGSEIWKDAIGCARQVQSLIYSRAF